MSDRIVDMDLALELALNDLLYLVAVGDPTDDPTGSGKGLTIQLLVGKVFTEALAASRVSSFSDRGKRLQTSGGSAVVYTVQHATHQVGDKIDFCMGGAGLLSLAAGANVTIQYKSGKGLKLDGPHAHACLICESVGATDVFTLVGEVVA